MYNDQGKRINESTQDSGGAITFYSLGMPQSQFGHTAGLLKSTATFKLIT